MFANIYTVKSGVANRGRLEATISAILQVGWERISCVFLGYIKSGKTENVKYFTQRCGELSFFKLWIYFNT